jgi:exonuclease SbcC
VRPLRLQVKGFTAFREECALDLEGFDLFAITGPTGSGKSSLLDAMTYALYGRVDRVGRQVAQLVSQGQPRMAVTLEFAVGDRRYRVTRSTPVRGASRAVLERWVEGTWRPEPADGVREVDAAVERIVGLDYEAFTRSVLLPQNRFAEFLVGDARERRRILTELLGLGLFERLGARARELQRDAESQVRARVALLEAEYADATEEAVARAEEALRREEARERAVVGAEREVAALLERWREAEREAGELRALAGEAEAAARRAREVAAELEREGDALARAGEQHVHRLEEARRAEEEAAAAEAALREAEGAWGTAARVAILLGRAEVRDRARATLARCRAELERARGEGPALQAELARAEEEVRARAREASASEAALAKAEEAHRLAEHRHLAAAVRAGVRVGEPCPVCGAPVRALPPRAAGEAEVSRTRKILERARKALEAARRALQEAERARDRAAAALESHGEGLRRREEEVARWEAEVGAAEADLRQAFGPVGLPEDPARELRCRAARLEELAVAARRAGEAAAAARERARETEAAIDRLRAEVRARRVALGAMPLAGLLERVRERAPEVPLLEPPPPDGLPEDPSRLARVAAGLSRDLEGLGAALGRTAEAREGAQRELVGRARAVAGPFVGAEGGLPEVAEALARASREQAGAVAAGRAEVTRARERLEAALRLREAVGSLERRAAVLGALASELRGDRVVAFLQVEALQVLAAGASERLSELSGGRYRLLYQGDEFHVVDTWNGEETRTARTLSGGETFLASLSLALALSEQVRSLAVTERARLDSLFLDEGFGTLDPETLETVVEAIEQLGADGRVVGVITHVPELAVRLPVRVEVVKSPRGSRLEVRT